MSLDMKESILFKRDIIINNHVNVFNYAIKSYEPGSVVKVLTMAAALDAGVVEPNTEFIDEGQIVRDISRIQHISADIVHGRYDVV